MSDSKSSGGFNVLGLLGVVFVTLKLCKVIDWSWWWVTAPFWGGVALVLVVVIIAWLMGTALLVYERFATSGRNQKRVR